MERVLTGHSVLLLQKKKAINKPISRRYVKSINGIGFIPKLIKNGKTTPGVVGV